MIPMVHWIAGTTGRRLGAWIVTAGAVPLSMLATSSNIRGEDFDFFPAVAAPTNLAILVGLILTAVAMRRHTDTPLAIVVGLPLTWLIGLPFSQFGSGLIVAGYWAAFAWLIENNRIGSAARTVTNGSSVPTPLPAN